MGKVTILLNGEKFHLNTESTISDLLKNLSLHPKGVAVEYNWNILRKKDYDKTILNDSDKVEIVQFVGGG